MSNNTPLMTETIYVCVPDEKGEAKGYNLIRLAPNGFEGALELIKKGWSVYRKTTTWERVEV